MRLRLDLYAGDEHVPLEFTGPGALEYVGGWMTDTDRALQSSPDMTFDIGDGIRRFKGRFGDLDRIDLTWEA